MRLGVLANRERWDRNGLGTMGGSTLMPWLRAPRRRDGRCARSLDFASLMHRYRSGCQGVARAARVPAGVRAGVVGRVPVAAFRDTRTRVVAMSWQSTGGHFARKDRFAVTLGVCSWQLHKLEKPRYSTRLDFKLSRWTPCLYRGVCRYVSPRLGTLRCYGGSAAQL